jgi:hypothetical protein
MNLPGGMETAWSTPSGLTRTVIVEPPPIGVSRATQPLS